MVPPIFNKFACLLKKNGGKRIIMDSKASGVTDATRRQYRAVLPRQTDLMSDVLALMSKQSDNDTVQLLVLDAEDAFLASSIASSGETLLLRSSTTR